MFRNILLTIQYDGTDFSGWQRQPDRMTVQGEIEKALSLICREDVTVAGTSRTDAGVHAYGQRAGFSGDYGIPTERIKKAVNGILPASVRIVAAEERPENFHARFDAKGKRYIYRIINSTEEDPFKRNYYYHVAGSLDTAAMAEAAMAIEGTHDFRSFQASGGSERESTVRTVKSLSLSAENSEITVEIIGDGFLYNMVRIISGTLVDVGRNKIRAADIKTIIEKKDRTKAGHTAPPQGLYLAEVYY